MGSKCPLCGMTKTTTHGMSGTPVYRIWNDMRRRCKDRRRSAFKDYGSRGIKMCKRWEKFENFLADMGDRPSLKHSLERMDNSRGYFPSNCVWSTMRQQCRNRRSNRMLTIDGRSAPLVVWAESVGIRTQTIHARLKRGWTPREAVTIGVINARKSDKRRITHSI